MLPLHQYYSKRTPEKTVDYEDAYWGTIVDPDGNVRDRTQERDQHLDDLKQELSFVESLSPGKIVDIGCGLGFFLSGIDDRWEKYGTELSQTAAEHASKFGRIHVGELQDAGYSDRFFDVVFIHHVIEHVPDPEQLMIEIRRILKPDGYLVLGTPDFDSGCARRFKEKYRLLHDDTHISLFTNESMHRFLRDHGFVIERVEYPFFETRHFTSDNLLRLFDTTKMSPPFYGNFMTFYCRNTSQPQNCDGLLELSRLTARIATEHAGSINTATTLLSNVVNAGGKILVGGDEGVVPSTLQHVDELIARLKEPLRSSLPNASAVTSPNRSEEPNSIENIQQLTDEQIASLDPAADALVLFAVTRRPLQVIQAATIAREKGLRTLAFVGPDVPAELGECDVVVSIPTDDTTRIQQVQMAILHQIYANVEASLNAK